MRISTAYAHILAMTPQERARFSKRKDLKGAEVIALKWYKKTVGMNNFIGPKLLDMGMDRTEGKVVEVHKIVGAKNLRDLSDAELDERWRARQSRAKGT
jgi:hypothetical protein